MAEEIIYCPSCNQKVRVPAEMLGTTVQCPLCRHVFTAPVRAGGPPPVTQVQEPPVVTLASRPLPSEASPPSDSPAGQPWAVDPYSREAARARLRVPATILCIATAMALAYDIVQIVQFRIEGVQGYAKQVEAQQEMMRQFLPAQQGFPTETMYVLTLVMLCVMSVMNLATLFASVQMFRMRGYGLAVTGSLLGILNLLNCPCCLVGFPASLWALILLFQPDVRNAFE